MLWTLKINSNNKREKNFASKTNDYLLNSNKYSEERMSITPPLIQITCTSTHFSPVQTTSIFQPLVQNVTPHLVQNTSPIIPPPRMKNTCTSIHLPPV